MPIEPRFKVPKMTFKPSRTLRRFSVATLLAGAFSVAGAQPFAPEITYGPNELMYKHIWEDVDARIGALPDGLMLSVFTTNDN